MTTTIAIEDVRREVKILRALNGHNNLIQFYEAKRMKMSWASYASMMGSFMYAMICTRPNITQAMGTISRFMTDRSREHWNAIKRILRYIKGTLDVTLRFEGLKHFVTGCVDFGFVGDLDKGRSINSFVFTLARRAMSWLSK